MRERVRDDPGAQRNRDSGEPQETGPPLGDGGSSGGGGGVRRQREFSSSLSRCSTTWCFLMFASWRWIVMVSLHRPLKWGYCWGRLNGGINNHSHRILSVRYTSDSYFFGESDSVSLLLRTNPTFCCTKKGMVFNNKIHMF